MCTAACCGIFSQAFSQAADGSISNSLPPSVSPSVCPYRDDLRPVVRTIGSSWYAVRTVVSRSSTGRRAVEKRPVTADSVVDKLPTRLDGLACLFPFAAAKTALCIPPGLTELRQSTTGPQSTSQRKRFLASATGRSSCVSYCPRLTDCAGVDSPPAW